MKGLVTVVGIEPTWHDVRCRCRLSRPVVMLVAKLDGVENSSSPSGGCVHRAGLLSASSLVGVGVVGWAGFALRIADMRSHLDTVCDGVADTASPKPFRLFKLMNAH